MQLSGMSVTLVFKSYQAMKLISPFSCELRLCGSLWYFFGIFVWPASAKSMAIVVSNGIISGPTVWVNRPLRFHWNAINIEKSQQQSILQRILGYRLIVSGSDEKILFVERVFDKNQVTEILKTIGYADSLAV
jgi:hypothetical protein